LVVTDRRTCKNDLCPIKPTLYIGPRNRKRELVKLEAPYGNRESRLKKSFFSGVSITITVFVKEKGKEKYADSSL